MTIRDYQLITNTGTTEEQIITHFKIDKSKSIDYVQNKLKEFVTIDTKVYVKRYIRLNGKLYKIEKNLQKLSYEQFSRLEMILAENNNVENLHKLLAIYIRPVNIFFRIRKYDMQEQEKIANELLNLDMSIAQSIINFFFLYGMNYMKNINISYLNLMKKMMKENQHIKNK